MLFDCNFKLASCYFECVAVSNIKKETSGHVLCKTADAPKYVAHVLGGAVKQIQTTSSQLRNA